MINLLSPDDRRQIAASRTNSLLLRYIFLLALLVAVMMLEMGGVYLLLTNEKARNESVISDNNQKTVTYAETKQRAAKFESDLATAKYILGQQVPYTKILTSIAQALPSEAVVDTLDLDPATFGSPTTLTIRTKSYSSAINVKASLQESKVFSDVSFQSVAQADNDTDGFPYTATYNVTYSKDILSL